MAKNIPDASILVEKLERASKKSTSSKSVIVYLGKDVKIDSGVDDFNLLRNRPKYMGEEMTGETSIPEVTNTDVRIGDLDSLETTAKESIVAAINELVQKMGDVETALHIANNGEES